MLKKKYVLAMIVFLVILTGGFYLYQQSFDVALRSSGFDVDSFILVAEDRIVHEENFSYASPRIGIARIEGTKESVWIEGSQVISLSPPHIMDFVLAVPRILQQGFNSSWRLRVVSIRDEEERPLWFEWDEFNEEWNTYPVNFFFDEALKSYQLLTWGRSAIWNVPSGTTSEDIPRRLRIGIYGDSFLASVYEALISQFNEEELGIELISVDDEFVLVLSSSNEPLLYLEVFEFATELLRSQ